MLEGQKIVSSGNSDKSNWIPSIFPRDHQEPPIISKLSSVPICSAGDHTLVGTEPSGLLIRTCWKGLSRGFGLVLCDFKEDSRKWDLLRDW